MDLRLRSAAFNKILCISVHLRKTRMNILPVATYRDSRPPQREGALVRKMIGENQRATTTQTLSALINQAADSVEFVRCFCTHHPTAAQVYCVVLVL